MGGKNLIFALYIHKYKHTQTNKHQGLLDDPTDMTFRMAPAPFLAPPAQVPHKTATGIEIAEVGISIIYKRMCCG